jgi:hypothetical protein
VRLVKLARFRNLVYAPESAPCMNTLRARIRTIPGGRVENGHYWVDMDAYEQQTQVRAGLNERIRALRTDPALDGLL